MNVTKGLITGFAILALFAIPTGMHAEATVDSISVSPISTTVVAGEDVIWKVSAHKTDNTTLDVTSSATFAIPEAAGGVLDHNVFTTQFVGHWQIPVSIGSYSTTAYVNVVHDSPVSLLVSPDTVAATADENITFTTTLKDAQGNEWDATGQTTFVSTEKNADIQTSSYSLKKIGSFVVTASIGDLQIHIPVVVTPGKPATLLLSPSQKFTLPVGSTQQISTMLLDADGNTITGKNAGLTLVGDAAALTSSGDIRGEKVGTVTLHAGYESLEAKTEIEIVKASVSSNNSSGRVLGESVNGNTNTSNDETTNEPAPTQNENTNPDATEDETCSNIELWVTLVMLAAYGLILLGYYVLIKRDNDKSWWIFPILVTAIGIIIWTKYFCSGTFTWWPWILGLLGVFITWYGRGPLRKNTSHDSMTGPSNPPQQQKPLF